MSIEERCVKLEEKFGRVKCRLRCLEIALCISILLLLSLAVALFFEIYAKDKGYGEFRKVKAVVFDLVDERGQTQALLSALKGGPSLWMLDSNESIRLSLSVSNDKPGIILFDENSVPRATLVLAANRVEFGLFDQHQTPGIVIIQEDEQSQLYIVDKNNNIRGTFGIDDESIPASSIRIYDPNQTMIWYAPQ